MVLFYSSINALLLTFNYRIVAGSFYERMVEFVRYREAFRSILLQGMIQRNIPSDFYSNEVDALIKAVKNKHFPECYLVSLFNPVLVITATLKHNKTRVAFLGKILSQQGVCADTMRLALSQACTEFEALPSHLQIKVTGSLRIVHGIDTTLKNYGSPGMIEKMANSPLGISKLAYYGTSVHNSKGMASLCQGIVARMCDFNAHHLKDLDNTGIPADERIYFRWAERYNAPWIVCSICVLCGIKIKIDEVTTWHDLGLEIGSSCGGLGVLTDENMKVPNVQRLLAALSVTRPVDFVKDGLTGLHPRELSMLVCLCKDYLGPALTCLDHNEGFVLPDVSQKRKTGGKQQTKKAKLTHVMKGSTVGVVSDVPTCRVE